MSQDDVSVDEFSGQGDSQVNAQAVTQADPPFDTVLDPSDSIYAKQEEFGAPASSHSSVVSTARRTCVVGSRPSVSFEHMERSELSTTLPQRIFVDSPSNNQSTGRSVNAPRVAVPAGPVSLAPSQWSAASAMTAVADSNSIHQAALTQLLAPTQERDAVPRTSRQQLRAIASFITSPFRIAWHAILALDEWLESYFRCLLLMDPRSRQRKNQPKCNPPPANRVIVSQHNPPLADSSADTQNRQHSL